MTHSFSALFCSCLVVGLCSACGGDTDSDKNKNDDQKTTVDSGVPAETEIRDMTTEQEQQLCTEVQRVVTEELVPSEVQPAICGAVGYMAAVEGSVDSLGEGEAVADPSAAAELCQQAYEECMAQESDQVSEPIDPENCDLSESECTATVGEIEACLNETNEKMDSLLGALPSCDDLEDEWNPALLVTAIPTSCLVLQEKCPEALGSASTSLDDAVSSGTEALSL